MTGVLGVPPDRSGSAMAGALDSRRYIAVFRGWGFDPRLPYLQSAGAIGNAIDFHAHCLCHGQPEIGDGRALR